SSLRVRAFASTLLNRRRGISASITRSSANSGPYVKSNDYWYSGYATHPSTRHRCPVGSHATTWGAPLRWPVARPSPGPSRGPKLGGKLAARYLLVSLGRP